MTSPSIWLRGASALAALLATGVAARTSVHVPPPEPIARSEIAVAMRADTDPMPFAVGEEANYDVKFGILHVGSGSMRVAGIDTIRGHNAWHIVFDIKGGTPFYHVNDTLESWFDVETLASLRFLQRLEEGGHARNRHYEIYPERSAFQLNQKPEEPSVSNPLDDGSFLYFVRTLPLNVGDTYTFNQYFNPKANPVTIRVLKREQIEVPAGKFNSIVVQPIIKTPGIFSEHGEAHVWLSDDSTRIVLQMKSKLSIGSLDLYLKSFRRGQQTGAAASTPSLSPPRSHP